MLTYYRVADGERRKITFEEALEIMLGSWKDSEMTRDMLNIANRIRCRFSVIEVHEIVDGREMVLMPGMWNRIPDGAEYDDDGNRI